MGTFCLLIDGLGEDTSLGATSLELCDHPNLDMIASKGRTLLYEPATRFSVPNPETYVVFPYFFGLPPQNNPGRSGWELYAQGIDIDMYSCCMLFRVISSNYNVRDGWYKATKLTDSNLSTVNEVLQRVLGELLSSKIVKSPLSKNIWCAGSVDKEAQEDLMHLLTYEFARNGLCCYPMLFHDHISTNNLVQRSSRKLFGWVIGPLQTALSYIGVECVLNSHDLKKELFNLSMKKEDYENNIRPDLLTHISNGGTGILYIKEPSTASRINDRTKKIDAIKFADYLLGDVYQQLGNSHSYVVLSDHQSNLGLERTFPGPTIIGYVDPNRICDSTWKFTEKDALKRESEQIFTQSDAITLLPI